VREENAWAQLAAMSERLATSAARVSTLEGDLWAANSSLEISMVRAMGLEAALESNKKP
jgi:hypothetical protein